MVTVTGTQAADEFVFSSATTSDRGLATPRETVPLTAPEPAPSLTRVVDKASVKSARSLSNTRTEAEAPTKPAAFAANSLDRVGSMAVSSTASTAKDCDARPAGMITDSGNNSRPVAGPTKDTDTA